MFIVAWSEYGMQKDLIDIAIVEDWWEVFAILHEDFDLRFLDDVDEEDIETACDLVNTYYDSDNTGKTTMITVRRYGSGNYLIQV